MNYFWAAPLVPLALTPNSRFTGGYVHRGETLVLGLDARRYLVAKGRRELPALEKFARAAEGPMAPAFAALDGKAQFVAAFADLPSLGTDDDLAGRALKALTGKGRSSTLTMAVGDTIEFRVRLDGGDPQARAEAVGELFAEAAAAVRTFARAMPAGADPDAVSAGAEALEAAKLSKAGSGREIAVSFRPRLGAWKAAGLDAARFYREAEDRAASAGNLRAIGNALLEYERMHEGLPPSVVRSKDGKPLLSWRVNLLLGLGEYELFEQVRLDEPWDSEHNKKLIPKMPASLRRPGSKEVGKTHYRAFTGKETGWGVDKGRSIIDILDGSSNTLAVFEAAEPIEWTRPDDFVFDPKAAIADKFAVWPNGESFVMSFDGWVRPIRPAKASDQSLRAFITAAGGEKFRFEDLAK